MGKDFIPVVGIRREDLQEDTTGDEVYILFAEEDGLCQLFVRLLSFSKRGP